ncbi:FAD-binding protein, partial [Blastococcus sp. URHD0036]|uniref:FAD-binding protein n=1 Tax=Blastococcus sp. URHD0036 TaxID=1380356 RepID=UPI0012DD5CA2
RYDRDAPTHGVPTAELALLETFYDRGAEAVQVLVDAGGLYLNRERGHIFPDYHADLPQNAAPIGRSFGPAMPPEQALAAGQAVNANLPGGTILIEVLRQAAKARGVKLLLGHRVVHVHQDDDGAVVGVEVHAGRGRGTVLVGARRGVVFASGGFLHDEQLARDFLRGPLLGGCASSGSTGDFIRIGIEAGAQLGNMQQAWWTQTVLDVVLRARETAEDIWFPFGDSMIQVDKYGRRVMDEKQTYNDRGPVHFAWDAGRREYPNLVLFQIYDDAVAQKESPEGFRGYIPFPGQPAPYVISGTTFAELAANIDARLVELREATGGVRLASDFAATLTRSVERFSEFARQGVDEDFGRGEEPGMTSMHALRVGGVGRAPAWAS